MRKGTLITIIALMAVLITVAVVQLSLASGDRPECPGPVASPNALPAQDDAADCR